MADGSNLRLRSQNTFLHVIDVTVEAQRLSRSKSDTSPSSSQQSNPRRYEGQSHQRALDPDHLVFNTDSSGRSQAETGSYPSQDNGEKAPVPTKQSLGSGDRSSSDHDSHALNEQLKPIEQPVGELRPCWSDGANLHESNQCRPCAFYWREEGCLTGAACSFCHMCDRDALMFSVEKRRKAKPRRHRDGFHAAPRKILVADALARDTPQLEHVADLECKGVSGMSAVASQQTNQFNRVRNQSGLTPGQPISLVSL